MLSAKSSHVFEWGKLGVFCQGLLELISVRGNWGMKEWGFARTLIIIIPFCFMNAIYCFRRTLDWCLFGFLATCMFDVFVNRGTCQVIRSKYCKLYFPRFVSYGKIDVCREVFSLYGLLLLQGNLLFCLTSYAGLFFLAWDKARVVL